MVCLKAILARRDDVKENGRAGMFILLVEKARDPCFNNSILYA